MKGPAERFSPILLSPPQYRLLQEGEELGDLLKLGSEDVLLRWLNFHVTRMGGTPVGNFGEALKDGSVYAAVLSSINPTACPPSVAAIADPTERAAAVIEAAKAMDVPVMVQVRA